MEWWQAILLGVVEGLTEYLPVSSTGHLLVVQKLLGIGMDSREAWEAANAYAICIQGGAIIAVLGLYFTRVRQAILGSLAKVGIGKAGRSDDEIANRADYLDAGWRMTVNLVVAFFPAAIIGLLLDDKIEQYLFGAWPVVASWFVGGAVILIVAWRRKPRGNERDEPTSTSSSQPEADAVTASDPTPHNQTHDAPALAKRKQLPLESLTWKMALAIGLMQCIAMWPGTSRSLVTIVGGVLAGLSLAAAVEFSFLLGVLTLCAATVYKALLDDATVTVDGAEQQVMMLHAMVKQYGWGPLIAGSVAAWLSAVLAVKWMVAYLNKHGMAIFGYYRIAIALITAGLILAGAIEATNAWDQSP